ncbi:MAG TPA: hypothetical protein VEI49_01410 [Terriglobales bacterium]|nr:hypothetical protein [Terriglobales bacterium]
MFPCPVCTHPREVWITKKRKPYITCDPCGIQLFVRGPAGIAAFEKLLDRAETEDLWSWLVEMERRYYLECSACGHQFWIEPGRRKSARFSLHREKLRGGGAVESEGIGITVVGMMMILVGVVVLPAFAISGWTRLARPGQIEWDQSLIEKRAQ